MCSCWSCVILSVRAHVSSPCVSARAAFHKRSTSALHYHLATISLQECSVLRCAARRQTCADREACWAPRTGRRRQSRLSWLHCNCAATDRHMPGARLAPVTVGKRACNPVTVGSRACHSGPQSLQPYVKTRTLTIPHAARVLVDAPDLYHLTPNGQRQVDRRLWRRLARAPEAVAARPVAGLLPWQCRAEPPRAARRAQMSRRSPQEPSPGATKGGSNTTTYLTSLRTCCAHMASTLG